jgi:hypothetical protein
MAEAPGRAIASKIETALRSPYGLGQRCACRGVYHFLPLLTPGNCIFRCDCPAWHLSRFLFVFPTLLNLPHYFAIVHTLARTQTVRAANHALARTQILQRITPLPTPIRRSQYRF